MADEKDIAQGTVDNTTEEDVVENTVQPDMDEKTVEKRQDTEEKKEAKEVDPAKEKEGILDRLMNKVFGKKEEEKPKNSGSEQVLEEDISERFEEAARKVGWTDEQIIDVANKYTNAQLEGLIPFITSDSEEEPVEEKKETKETKKTKVVDSLKVGDKTLEAYLEQIEKAIDAKYQEKFGKIEQGLKTTEQDRLNKEVQRYQTTADGFFDKASKEFPVFGTTDKLLRFPKGTPQAGQIIPVGEAFNARNEVWKAAMAFHSMGTDLDEALNEALVWYKGKNMEKDVRSKVLKELKAKEKNLSPKRSERSISEKNLTPDEEKDELIGDLMRRAGIG